MALALAIGAILIWRQAAMERELRVLRQAAVQGNGVSASNGTLTLQATEWTAPAAPESADLQELREQAEKNAQRLAELEAVVTQMATLVNGMLDEAEQRKTAANRKSWGAGQACGPPDTFQAGDLPTAWAPAKQVGGEEWLQLEFGEPLSVSQVLVRETYNPGAISKVVALLDDGSELTIWQGTEPTAAAPVDRQFAAMPGTVSRMVKVYLDTRRVPGWNEIDAVAIVTPDGQRHWATNASASSSYGESQPGGNPVDLFFSSATDGGLRAR